MIRFDPKELGLIGGIQLIEQLIDGGMFWLNSLAYFKFANGFIFLANFDQ